MCFSKLHGRTLHTILYNTTDPTKSPTFSSLLASLRLLPARLVGRGVYWESRNFPVTFAFTELLLCASNNKSNKQPGSHCWSKYQLQSHLIENCNEIPFHCVLIDPQNVYTPTPCPAMCMLYIPCYIHTPMIFNPFQTSQ